MKRKDRSNAKSESGNGPISFGRRTFLGGIGALGAQAAATTLLPRAALAQASADGPAPKELNPDTMLWYRQPAANWLEAIPLGNGRIGAMVFGGVSHEQILLNEDTLYAEEPGGRTLPLDITKEFDHVVGLLKSGEYMKPTMSSPRIGLAAPGLAINLSAPCICASTEKTKGLTTFVSSICRTLWRMPSIAAAARPSSARSSQAMPTMPSYCECRLTNPAPWILSLPLIPRIRPQNSPAAGRAKLF